MPRLCGIGTGADSLRFQCLQGPILIHFVGHNTLHVIFDIHYVNYRQCAVVIAAVLKPAGIFIALAPCLCVPPLGTDTKAIAAFIKPKRTLPLPVSVTTTPFLEPVTRMVMVVSSVSSK